jgi:hypothetical protein
MRLRTIVALPAVLLAACSEPPPPEVPPAPPPPPPTVSAVVEAPPPPAKPKPVFENPGGMWMPQQLASHAEKLKSLGLEIDPAELTDPTSKTLGSIVSLGGCSASFVSDEGLVVTNHHCVQAALQFNSTPEKNLIKEGFLARTRAEEKSNGPQGRVFVTRSVKDVTARVLEGLDKIKGDKERFEAIESRQKQITSDCERGKTGTRCQVAKFFEGAQYFQIEQLELRDIRLVYAPDAGIGNFGGEIDNWRWPRHTGDFSFYRAYVGKDGQPADYSPENVPFKPAHHLKLASQPLEEGDLVLIAGYPGRTSRWRTSSEVKEAVEWSYPRRQRFCEEYIAALEAVSKTDKVAAIRGAPLLRGLNNALTNTKGQLDGLIKGGLAREKNRLEADLKAFIAKDPRLTSEAGGVLEKMAALHAEQAKFRELDASLDEVLRMSRLLSVAVSIVRMAEERPRADADRKPDYQERNWKRLEQGMTAMEKTYSQAVDRATFGLALRRLARLPADQGGPLLAALTGKKKPSEADLTRAVDALYKEPALENLDTRLKLLGSATTKDLAKNKDHALALARKIRPLIKAQEDRDEAYSGAMSLLRPRYIEALRGLMKGELAPDANSTLRITYGTVRGYKPAPEAAPYAPFTLLSQAAAKARPEEPFLAPARLLDGIKAGKFGPYLDKKLGEVPVNFLSDLHITGGNSGSATLNARGELVGLAFDGNYEAMASDWVFLPSITRTIHVDARYMLWVMDAVDGADHLVSEMGARPSLP